MKKNTKSTFVGWKDIYSVQVSNYYLTKIRNYLKKKTGVFFDKLKLYHAHAVEKTNYHGWKNTFFRKTFDYLITSAILAFIILTLQTHNVLLQGLGVAALLSITLAFIKGVRKTKE